MNKRFGKVLHTHIWIYYVLLASFAVAALLAEQFILAAVESSVTAIALIAVLLQRRHRRKELQKFLSRVSAEQTGSYLVYFIRMFFSGIVAAACMIIPGISGSFVMMLLGVYGPVIGAVAQLTSAPFAAVPTLAPLGIGCLLGLFGCAKLIEWLMAHHEQATYSAILGFVIGGDQK